MRCSVARSGSAYKVSGSARDSDALRVTAGTLAVCVSPGDAPPHRHPAHRPCLSMRSIHASTSGGRSQRSRTT